MYYTGGNVASICWAALGWCILPSVPLRTEPLRDPECSLCTRYWPSSPKSRPARHEAQNKQKRCQGNLACTGESGAQMLGILRVKQGQRHLSIQAWPLAKSSTAKRTCRKNPEALLTRGDNCGFFKATQAASNIRKEAEKKLAQIRPVTSDS